LSPLPEFHLDLDNLTADAGVSGFVSEGLTSEE